MWPAEAVGTFHPSWRHWSDHQVANRDLAVMRPTVRALVPALAPSRVSRRYLSIFSIVFSLGITLVFDYEGMAFSETTLKPC
jgi:hypothetical protein